jgi:uncharacterized protein (DUF697 family)/GTP-binding protein EngB required for normal cell division
MKPTILICGQTGTGKSSIVNFRLRKPVARVGNAAESVRNGFPPPRYENKSVIFYDSDGYEIGEKQTGEYKENLLGFLSNNMEKGGMPLVWYTINAAAHRVTPFDREIVGLIKQNIPVGILLSKIDECDEGKLSNFYDEVSEFIPETDVFKVSTINGDVQKYTDWDALVEWTTEMLNRIEIVRKLQLPAVKACEVIKGTHIAAGLSAAIPIPLLDSAVLIPILGGMVSKILAVYDLSLNDNVVVHVIKSTWTQILGKTAIRSVFKLIPVVGWIASAAAGGAGNALIANSLGEATIYICNKYLFDELSGSANKRNFEDIFTSGEFASAVKKHMENKGDAAWAS